MIYIGIDPGKDGAVAILSPGAICLTITDTPTIPGLRKGNSYDEQAMAGLLRPFSGCMHGTVHVLLELTHAMPGQGVTSMFSMGEGLGLWKGILAAFQIPHTLVTPQRWKKSMLADVVVGECKDKAARTKMLKAASVKQAQRLFPGVAFVGPRGGERDGQAEAALIAEYGRRTLSQNGSADPTAVSAL